MSLSNYPPGVTGAEYDIAGPDSEEEVIETCPADDCGYSGYVTVVHYREQWWWDCPECGLRTEGDDSEVEYEDPDSKYDSRFDLED